MAIALCALISALLIILYAVGFACAKKYIGICARLPVALFKTLCSIYNLFKGLILCYNFYCSDAANAMGILFSAILFIAQDIFVMISSSLNYPHALNKEVVFMMR